MQDEAYRDFHAKLIPNVDKETIIGVRVPELRKYAKKIAAHSLVGEFLSEPSSCISNKRVLISSVK